MYQIAKPIIIEIDSDDDQIPRAQQLSTRRTKGLSKYTPSRQSFFDALPASSTKSSSPSPRIFDDDSIPVGTPLTPLSLDKPHPSASLRSSSSEFKTSRLSFKNKDPEESCFPNGDPSTAAASGRGTRPRPSTPKFGDQNSEQHDLGSMNDVSSCLSHLELSNSPLVQKQRRGKLGREAAASTESISELFGSMSLEHDDTISRRQSGTGNHATDDLDLIFVTYDGGSSHVLSHDMDVLDSDKKETPKLRLPESNTKRKKVVKNFARSSIPEIANLDEAHKKPLCSPITPAPTPSKLMSKPKKSSKSLSPNHSGARLRSRSEPQPQLDNSVDSPSVSGSSSPKLRRRAPRKSTNSPSDSEAVKAQAIDSTTKSHSSSTKNCVPKPREQVADCDFDTTESTDIPRTPSKNTPTTHREAAQNIQEEPQVTRPKFKKYHMEERAPGKELDQEILHVIRRKNQEKKLDKHSVTTQLLHAFSLIIPNKWCPSLFNTDEGFIYIFKSSEYPGYVKIGKTKQQPAQRISQWATQCKKGFTCIHVLDPNDKSFVHYGVVEELVQRELWNERRKFECKHCGKCHELEQEQRGAKKSQTEQKNRRATEHGEWYEITEAHALAVVEKWRGWIVKQHPYTWRGVLSQFWLWEYQKAMACTKVDWVKWCSPERFERLLYIWHCMCDMPKRDLLFVLAFMAAAVVVLGSINLFLPIGRSGMWVVKTGLIIPSVIVIYRRFYW